MPAMPKPTKRRAKVGTKSYDNKLYRKFEGPDAKFAEEPDTRDYMRDYYFRRRHLATVINPNGNFRMLKFLIELEEMDSAVSEGLERIKQRDGAKIVEEVSSVLLLEVLKSIEYVRGGLPKSWRNVFRELVAERRKEDDRIDARLRRQREGSNAIAA